MRDGDRVLMVRQRGPDDRDAWWYVPGGRVERDETPEQACVRELREETGVVAEGTLRRVYEVATGAGFEVARWSGDVRSADPDGLVLEARFVPLAEAIERIRAVPHAVMREPILSYLEELAAG